MIMDNNKLTEYYFKPEKEEICGEVIKPITDYYNENHTKVVDRFFKRYYFIKELPERAAYQILFHTNRVCLICLAPEHPALLKGISSLSYNIGNVDRSKNEVKGKAKKGGMILQSDSTLALLTVKTGETYKIPACIRSKLIEVNTKWLENPEKLQTATEGENYIAIVLPKPEYCEEIKANLMNEDQYQDYLKNEHKNI